MTYVSIAAGLRRYDAFLAAADATAERFVGLPANTAPGKALAALKRAARPLGASARLVQLIDLLFAWTKPVDWSPGRAPIVWPRNEALSEAMGVTVRQVQNLLREAVRIGLIAHRDSPNGHRGGKRNAEGQIVWAYGIDLSPIGTRYPELVQLGEAALAETRARDALRRRITIARKSIAQIAQTAIEQNLIGAEWRQEVDVARSGVEHARGLRSIEGLSAVVEQLEQRRARLHAAFTTALAARSASSANAENGGSQAAPAADKCYDISRSREADCMDSTTTKRLQPAKADLCSGSGVWGSRKPQRLSGEPSAVEADLERHGVAVDFIGRACADITWELEFGPRRWGDLVRIAERLAGQNGMPVHAWREACRVMGDRGAAAAVIATVHKHRTGEVRSPGAYLRGMTSKAAAGELQLGRTYHGLREAVAA